MDAPSTENGVTSTTETTHAITLSSAPKEPSSQSDITSESASVPPAVTSSNANTTTTTTTTEDITKDKADEKKVIFSGNVLTKHNKLVALSLSSEAITWKDKDPCSILMSTVLGVTTIKRYFTVHYIHVGKKHKTKETHSFKCETDQIPKQWADAIHTSLNQSGKGTQGLRVVFVINPFSGTRKAVSVFASVRSLFDIAGMVVTVIETNAAGHAREIGRTIDLKTVDRLVTVSGDGLFNELINGIMDRPDWREASKLPLGVIPAGSGNGLAFSLGHANAFEAALAVVKGSSRPFDILRTVQNGRVMYGFLTLTWAMISDVDIESEKMRWMGSIRFSIGALKRVISLRKYKGKLTYLPAEGSSDPYSLCGSFQQCAKCSHPVSNLHFFVKLHLDRFYIPQEAEPAQDLQSILYDSTQAPPAGWQVLDDDFVVFIATNVAHISTDFMASPYPYRQLYIKYCLTSK